MQIFVILIYSIFFGENLIVTPQAVQKRDANINKIKAKQDKVVYEEEAEDSKVVEGSQRDLHYGFNNSLVLSLDSQWLHPTFQATNQDTTPMSLPLVDEQDNISTKLQNEFIAVTSPSFQYDDASALENDDIKISTISSAFDVNSESEYVDFNVDDINDNKTTPLTHDYIELNKQHDMGQANDTFFDQRRSLVNSTYDLTIVNADENIVSKCCGQNQIFNLSSNSCEGSEINLEFNSLVSVLLFESERKKVLPHFIPFKFCPMSEVVPTILSDVNTDTFLLLPTGELYEIESEIVYTTLEYCLEVGGSNVGSHYLTLKYCPKYSEEYFELGNEYDSELSTPEFLDSKHFVRKCCGRNEYYNADFHRCTQLDNSELFQSLIQGLTFENNATVETYSSRLHECPGQSGPPSVVGVTENQYKLLANGELIEIATGTQYNTTYYCLELVGENAEALTFTLAFCSQTIAIQKCCSAQSYFDEIALNCKTIHPNISSETEPIISVFQKDINKYLVVPMEAFLMCENTFPVEEPSEHFVIEDGQLCNEITCFERSDYCIEYIGKRNTNLQPKAFYCQREFFVKCCKKGFVLSENGCQPHDGKPSIYLRQLQNTRSYVNSFDSKKCKMGRGIFLDDSLSSYVNWWVNKDGRYLTVVSDLEKIKTPYYCIDDYFSTDRKISSTGAFVCEDVVSHLVPKEKSSLKFSEHAVVNKCCPTSSAKGTIYYYSKETGNCELFSTDQSLFDEIKFDNFTDLQFGDFPLCQNEEIKGYSAYSLQPGLNDYAIVTQSGILNVVSVDGRCAVREDVVGHQDYCVEYTLAENKTLVASAFVCSYETVTDFYKEKFTLVTSLLGISCVCLLATLSFLFTMRVRRGLISVRKVNTLAGKILVSFVSSHLLGFVALTLTQHKNLLNQATSYSCYVIAGMIEFFNLATFCWNTSICLESLLLTFHIAISECLRYTLHSLWAWGFPSLMTLIMFLMDFHREELPCHIVTPKIGVSGCFLKDANAIMLYFYLPILITLIANISLLILAKSMRKFRLRKLEGIKPRKKTGFGRKSEVGTASEKNAGHNSGLRTHQNKNTKVESMRLVFWTGGLWFAELFGFVMNGYIFPNNSKTWYRYLWYIPTSLNALRGVGVFIIVVLTPEMRDKIKGHFKRIMRPIFKILFSRCSWASVHMDKRKPSSYAKNSVSQSNDFHNQRKRNMSVVTVISNLSSSFHSSALQTDSLDDTVRKQSISRYVSSKWTSIKERSSAANSDKIKSRTNSLGNSTAIRKFGIIRSVSQIDQQPSTSSITAPEEIEMTIDYSMRSTPTNLLTTQLPRLLEEDNISNKGLEECSKNL